jgi:hypothetical protein
MSKGSGKAQSVPRTVTSLESWRLQNAQNNNASKRIAYQGAYDPSEMVDISRLLPAMAKNTKLHTAIHNTTPAMMYLGKLVLPPIDIVIAERIKAMATGQLGSREPTHAKTAERKPSSLNGWGYIAEERTINQPMTVFSLGGATVHLCKLTPKVRSRIDGGHSNIWQYEEATRDIKWRVSPGDILNIFPYPLRRAGASDAYRVTEGAQLTELVSQKSSPTDIKVLDVLATQVPELEPYRPAAIMARANEHMPDYALAQ